mgnify:CR=1 FL=1
MILGIDEVGRGPYAGPLVIGACILPDAKIVEQDPEKYAWISELTDSKKLSAKKRENLYKKIKEGALATATGWVKSSEIDKYGISESLKLACRRAVKKIQETKVQFSEIIIDGTMNFLVETSLEKYVSTLKKGDFLIKEISAASIIAKVERDRYMIQLAKIYPEYGFEKHVGYGTRLHQTAMEKFGLMPEHRKSFRPVRAIYEKFQQIETKTHAKDEDVVVFDEIHDSLKMQGNHESRRDILKSKDEAELNNELRSRQQNVLSSKDIGNIGEDVVIKYLEKQGHRIITRNFKTNLFEIDIISQKDNLLFFTEVKYRKNEIFGEPISFINSNKYRQMNFAMQGFLTLHPEYKILDSKLAVAGVIGGNFKLQEWLILDE